MQTNICGLGKTFLVNALHIDLNSAVFLELQLQNEWTMDEHWLKGAKCKKST